MATCLGRFQWSPVNIMKHEVAQQQSLPCHKEVLASKATHCEIFLIAVSVF